MLKRLFRKERAVLFEGPVVDLKLETDIPASEDNDQVRSVYFGIYLHRSFVKVGTCDLRIGDHWTLYHAGHIGYRIMPLYRGHGYAYEACRVLLPEAKKTYGFRSLWITCSPDNTASRKTLEKLGGTLLETAEVPASHWLYRRGETIKNIYYFEL